MMPEFRADLHCHTTCSDGTTSPEKLILLAKESGLKGLSITDHDTVQAYASAIPVAKTQNLEIISGVEFSAVHQGVNVHILCYSFHPENPIILNVCQTLQKRREERIKEILGKLAANRMPVTEEELNAISEEYSTNHSLGRPHIALAMLRKNYVTSIQDAFNLYIGEDCSCYVPGNLFSVEETLDTIRKANGIAILAHPHLFKSSKKAFVDSLLNMPFDGLEGYYSRFTNDQNFKWLDVAKKKNWLITGGSDFHGDIKPTITLGCSWVGEEMFRHLQNHYLNNLKTKDNPA